MTIGYITIGYNDEAAAVAFYDAVFGAIGYERGPVENGWAFYGKGDARRASACANPMTAARRAAATAP